MLINDWRQDWRLWSVRVCAAAATIYAFMLAAPDQVLALWQALPPQIQEMIPNRTEIAAALFFAAAIARVLRQQGAAPAAATPAPLSLMARVEPWRAAALAPISRAITSIAVHCTATREGQPFKAADIRAWHKAQGWQDIGYHFIVGLDGTIEIGRPKARPGAHVAGYNGSSVGIVYVGGVASDGKTPKDTRTPAQKTAMLDLLRALRQAHPAAVIKGHRDYPRVAKACPSFDAKGEYTGMSA
jgi:hypothetical protein